MGLVIDKVQPWSRGGSDVSGAAKKARTCMELAEKIEPHRGTSAGAVAGTIAGSIGGLAVVSLLVFPPTAPFVILGGFLGFKWGSGS